jgi:hypothetical protein
MRTELLYWAGCPSHEKALAELRGAMSELGLDPSTIVVRELITDADAQHEQFVGSPTVRVDGVDVDSTSAADNPIGLACRVYRRRDGRFAPTPDPADLRDALARAAAVADTSHERPELAAQRA